MRNKGGAESKEKGVPGGNRSRKALERTATFGLILVALGLLVPFTFLSNTAFVSWFKWIYSSGALIFTVARVAGSTDPSDSMRVRRLRRLEFWAGVAFCMGAFFWFYNEDRYSFLLSGNVGILTVLRETVYFTLAGAVIQVLAVFALGYRLRKENKANK